jgi:hypothetical protein
MDNTDSYRWIYVPSTMLRKQGHETSNTLSLVAKTMRWEGMAALGNDATRST